MLWKCKKDKSYQHRTKMHKKCIFFLAGKKLIHTFALPNFSAVLLSQYIQCSCREMGLTI